MKYIVVEYADTVSVTGATIDATASIVVGATTITGGKITGVMQMSNPPAQTLIAHTHTTPGGTGSVSLPVGNSGPAVKT